MLGNKADLDVKSASYSLLSAGLNSTNNSRNPASSIENYNTSNSVYSFSINTDKQQTDTDDNEEVIIKLPQRHR